jgi:hypothetical protein
LDRTLLREARREEIRLRLRGTALETRRRLRPLGRALSPLAILVRGFAGRIAPYVSRGLLLLVTIPAALVALVLAIAQKVLGWLGERIVTAAAVIAAVASTRVTPRSTVAFVAMAAAVALGVSQFFDYSGIAVGANLYEGEVGGVAPVPLTDLERAGDAHLWLLLPVAILALVIARETYRGQWQLGRLVGLLGLVGIAVSLLVDLPQGLDGGRSGASYSGGQAQLIEGWWAQLAASAVLAFSGPLLGSYVRRTAGLSPDRNGHRRARILGRRRPRRERRKVGPAVARGGIGS